MAFVRPFTYEMWIGLMTVVVAWGIILWMQEWLWIKLVKEPGVHFSTSLLYSWGALLEQPPRDPSVSISGQIMVGWWLLFCLIISTSFKSSLISHLTVQSTTKTLETFSDLVNQDNWRWGTESWIYNGAALEYFSKHTDPVVQEIHEEMEVLDAKQALRNVLDGGFSFIIAEPYLKVMLATRYTDVKGWNPFYISKKGIFYIPSAGWSIRKGSPLFTKFRELIQRMMDAGIVNYLIDDVITRRVREERDTSNTMLNTIQNEGVGRDVVLGLRHLQGAFYILFLGSLMALLFLIAETLAYYHHSNP